MNFSFVVLIKMTEKKKMNEKQKIIKDKTRKILKKFEADEEGVEPVAEIKEKKRNSFYFL